MFQLKDTHGYAINPENICLIEAREPTHPLHPIRHIFVAGKDSLMTYEYDNSGDMIDDLENLRRCFDGIVAEGNENFGPYYINTKNIFSVGPAEEGRLELHFSGGFRTAVMLKDASEVRRTIMGKA